MKTSSLILFGLLFAVFFMGCKKDKDPTPYDNASSSNGGISYDKFWSAEAGFDQNNTHLATFNDYGDFFRCKQCHAWDLLGTNGSYINRGAKTTRPNVAALDLYSYAHSKTAQELFDGMKKTTDRRDVSYDLSTYDPTTNSTTGDQMPNYSQVLTDAQIWDIVKFMKEGAYDVSQLYDAVYTGVYPTGTATYSNLGKDGNADNGKTYFADNCADCHGSDGKLFLVEEMSIGKFTRNKPNEVQHKVRFGTLGSAMEGKFDITLSQMKDLYKALADQTTFPD